MKLVTAVIRPFKLDDVRTALQAFSVAGLTVTAVDGYGRQRGHKEIYRGAEYEVDFVPKVKLEIVVEEEMAPLVIEAIASSARTGKIGDGKIFVSKVEEAIRIRTGERGADAL